MFLTEISIRAKKQLKKPKLGRSLYFSASDTVAVIGGKTITITKRWRIQMFDYMNLKIR